MSVVNNKIFISHSNKDIKYVRSLVELMEAIGLTEKDMFCSSVPEYGIPLGKDIYEYLAEEFTSFNLIVIFILSENYYRSAACLNEMGAAWVMKKECYTILLPGFEFERIRGAIDPRKIALKLGENTREVKHGLAHLRDVIYSQFEIPKITETRWERYRDEFIDKTSK